MKHSIHHSGWVIVDKPPLVSSMDVVRLFKKKGFSKVGHGGTLDPFATGVLPVALGEATKLLSFFLQGNKAYIFTVSWGQATTTYDCEGPVTFSSSTRPSCQDIEGVLPSFSGMQHQRPPRFSAIKVNGVRSYKRARNQEDFVLPPRIVFIHHLSLLCAESSRALFFVICSKGTYIRSLGNDLAIKLGSYGHLTALRRTLCGPFDISHGISLDSLEKIRHDKESFLWPLEKVLDDIPALCINKEQANCLQRGNPIFYGGSQKVRWCKYAQKIVALVEQHQNLLWPKRVFNE